MVKVIISGAGGRMGKSLIDVFASSKDIELVYGLENPDSNMVSQTITDVNNRVKLQISDNLNEIIEYCDTIVDFSSIDGTLKNVSTAAEHGKSIVVGTTGLSEEQIEKIRKVSYKIPIVLAPNMSLGINFMFYLIGKMTNVLHDFDIEIIEAHHNQKKDAPSGTAVKLSEIIEEARAKDNPVDFTYGRKGFTGVRNKNEVGISVIRAGDIVGEHTVLFGNTGERLELTHKASSRDTFSKGALKATLWLKDKKPGLYSMMDVLGLTD